MGVSRLRPKIGSAATLAEAGSVKNRKSVELPSGEEARMVVRSGAGPAVTGAIKELKAALFESLSVCANASRPPPPIIFQLTVAELIQCKAVLATKTCRPATEPEFTR